MKNRFFDQVRALFIRTRQFFQRQSSIRKILIVGFLLIGTPLLGAFLLYVMVWSGLTGRLPDREELRKVQNPVASEVYSADSVLLGRYFIQERSDVGFQEIPKHVLSALQATEDIRFYDHGGIDVKSFMRVLVKSILLQDESSGGGSTITQQLAKNLYPRRNYWLFSVAINKTREMIIAARLEDVYSKDEILTLYLNTIPFGDNTYGIETAAQRFFSTPTRKLRIEQGAVLVGMLKATHSYNPRVFPERSRQRRDVVLNQMKKYDMISPARYDSLVALPLKLQYNRITHHEGLAPYFRDNIREVLLEWCSTHTREDGEPYNLYTDGLKVFTTIDSRLQRHAEDAVRQQMSVIQKKFNDHWSRTKPWDKRPEILTDATRRSERYANLKKQGMTDDQIMKAMEKKTLMNVFQWEGEQEKMMSPLDSIEHYLSFLNAGVLAMDPRDGSVRAWVGGIDHRYFQYDHVKKTTRRQVGSTFKPIVYAAALENGADPCDFISAEKIVYTDREGWTPTNSGEENYDLKYSMSGALAYSVNTVSVKVLEKAGIQNTLSLAKRMGISGDMPSVPSLALGVADLSMTEMVTAYACFANKGNVVQPQFITSITTRDGEILERFQQAPEQKALSQENALLMLHMLKRTINEGTGSRLRNQYGIRGEVAGKTGTTQSNADGWFIAVMPRLVIGAWVGADDPRIHFRSTSLGQGASTALPIVGKMLQHVQNDRNINRLLSDQFPVLPPSLQRKLNCPLYKSDTNFFERLFGKPEKNNRRAFGDGDKKKKGFFKKIFGNR